MARRLPSRPSLSNFVPSRSTSASQLSGAQLNIGGRSLNVLHFYRTYFPETQGGLEEAIRQICLTTAAHGIDSRVLTLAWKPQPMTVTLPEATVIRGHRQLDLASCSMGLASFRQYREQMEWADVINLHYPWPFADLVHLASGCAKPVVVTYHSDIVRQRWLNMLYSPLRHWLFQRAARIVATSDNYVATSPVLHHYRNKTAVIPLGLERSTCAPADAAAHEQVARQYGRNFYLFVGVLRYYKGLRFLIEAARGAPFDVVIAGCGPIDGELQAQARALGGTNVHFAGRVSDAVKAALMAQCRAVVFPSHLRSEAFGVTLIEGAMYGKPLISTEIGTGTSYVNQDGETGLVVAPADAGALRRAMDRLWEEPVLAARMGDAALARYEAHFSGRSLGERYGHLYHELAGR